MSGERPYPRSGFLGWMNVLKWEGMREQDRANERRVSTYSVLWALGLIGVAACVAFLDLPVWLDWTLALIPAAFGLICMKAYLKLLREADEMMRQIQLEAMAVGFGTGLIVGNTLVVLDFPRDWIAPAIVAPMAFAYTIRVILAGCEMARDTAEADESAMAREFEQ